MSMRDESRFLTKKAILEAISTAKKGMTRADLIDIFGFSYSTADNYTTELYQEGKIEMSPQKNSRSIVWVAKDPKRMPSLGGIPVWKVLTKQAKDTTIAAYPQYSMVYRRYMWNIMQLFNQALNKGNGVPVTENDLIDIRNKLVGNKKILETLIQAHNEIIDNPMLIDPAKFRDVLFGDKETPVDLEKYNSVKTAIEQMILAAKENV